MLSTKLSDKSKALYTSPDAIAARLRAEIQALARSGNAALAIQICEEEAQELRLASMSAAELQQEIAHIAPDYAHSVRKLHLVHSRTDLRAPDEPWSA